MADQLQLTSGDTNPVFILGRSGSGLECCQSGYSQCAQSSLSRDRLIGEARSINSFVVFDQQTRIDANIRFSNNGDVLFESPTGLSREIVVPFWETRAVVVRGLGKPANFMGIVGFSDGSFGAAVDVIRDGNSLKWKTSSGVTLTSAEPLFNLEGFHVWSQLHYFRPVQDSVIYLDSLEPTSAMTLSLFDGELGHRSASSNGMTTHHFRRRKLD